MTTNSFLIATSFESPTQKNSNDHLWELYTSIKKARPKFDNNIGNSNTVESYNLAVKKSKLNHLANLITGYLLHSILNSNDTINVLSITWEYKISEKAIINYDSQLRRLINEVGTLKNIPGYIIGQYNVIVPKYQSSSETEKSLELFNSKFSFLEGTTFSFRLDNGTNRGLYFCIPYAALKTEYLIKFFKKCDIEIPCFSHVTRKPNLVNKQNEVHDKPEPLFLDHEISYESLYNQMMKFGLKARSVIKEQYLAKR